ncbi:hypothetical protein GGI42DRAFT_351414 [Trichoderma sp. SZMC 28013]
MHFFSNAIFIITALATSAQATSISCVSRCIGLGGATGGGVNCIQSHYFSWQNDDSSLCLSVNHNSVVEGEAGSCAQILNQVQVPSHWSSYGGANCNSLIGSHWQLQSNGYLSFQTASDLEGCSAGIPADATQYSLANSKKCTPHK